MDRVNYTLILPVTFHSALALWTHVRYSNPRTVQTMAPSPQKGSLVRPSAFKAEALSILGSLLALRRQAASTCPVFIRLPIRGPLPPRQPSRWLGSASRSALRLHSAGRRFTFALGLRISACFTSLWSRHVTGLVFCENKRLRGLSDFVKERSPFPRRHWASQVLRARTGARSLPPVGLHLGGRRFLRRGLGTFRCA